jgi:hypothetical protein
LFLPPDLRRVLCHLRSASPVFAGDQGQLTSDGSVSVLLESIAISDVATAPYCSPPNKGGASHVGHETSS